VRLSKELRVKRVIYIIHRSSCRTYNLSVYYLPLEIVVCLNLEKDKNDNKKAQNSGFH